MGQNLNPLKNVRFMDYCFTLDTSFKNSNRTWRDYMPGFGDTTLIKRIDRVEHDITHEESTYFIEEKFPDKTKIWKGEETFGYLKEW